MAWWIFGKDPNGDPYLRGPYASEYRAQLRRDEQTGIDGEIINLPTVDRAKATSILKEKRVVELGFEEGTKKFKHPKEVAE